MKRALLITGIFAVAVAANAQTRGSFHVPSSLTGITINSSSKLDYSLSVATGASTFYQGKTYQISNVRGFFLLDNDNDMNVDGHSSGVWSYTENYTGQGGVAGYRTSGTGVTPNNSPKDFHFDKVNGTVEKYGIKINLKDCKDTLYLEIPCTPVPEPASMAVLGLGVVGIIRRRKNRR